MRKVLGLDLGIASIGWAVIEENDTRKQILGMGTRIIPIGADEKDEFSSGNKISKNQNRTSKRTQRKGYDRYQLRRANLIKELQSRNMLPNENLMELPALELYGLRNKAVSEKVSVQELGRILLHLNQKRGYKSSRSDANLDKKDTDYVAEVKNRYEKIREYNFTVGQYFYIGLGMNTSEDKWIRFAEQYNLPDSLPFQVKEQVFPREAYIEEFRLICDHQKTYYPTLLTDSFIEKIQNEIIYYQRPLKSQKGLVGICELENFIKIKPDGKSITIGPKCAPKSSPLFQVCKIWEVINTISLSNKTGQKLVITLDQKQQLFEHLDNNEKLSQAELFKILGLKKDDGWYGNKQIAKGLTGNITKVAIAKHLEELESKDGLLSFILSLDEIRDKSTYLVDKKTGEVIETKSVKTIRPDIEEQPLYKLWHVIYSIADIDECKHTLMKKFNLPETIALKLAGIDFGRYGFGNKSVKAMRKILPYLMEGYVYSDSCMFAGYNHSNSLTLSEQQERRLADKLALLSKNSLRQPVVEKILNQMINLVNAIIEKYGKPDEIRLELARELKQGQKERNEMFFNNSKRDRENKTIIEYIENGYKQYGIRATRNTIQKWRLFHEMNDGENKLNAMCLYCGKLFSISDALSGNNIDVEHIIPKARLFDDSHGNKILSHRSCNSDKDNRTAYDYMQSKSEQELHQYIERIEFLYKKQVISKSKRDKLLMTADKIPDDFIERQLRETQYISRKAREILEQVSNNVTTTTGTITAYLRKIWGWDEVLPNLQLPKYRDYGLTEMRISGKDNRTREVIKDWTKRDDHRHHAIDALVVACTKQSFIQRLNTLNSRRDQMMKDFTDTGNKYDSSKSLLENYLFAHKPFTTKEIETLASTILVSFKTGKKVATSGIRKIKKNGKKITVQKGITIPRGALSEEQVYGKIKGIETKPVKYLFENPHLIFKPYIKEHVERRLREHGNDLKKALSSIKKNPIYLDEEKTIELTYGSCITTKVVYKYPLTSITAKDVDSIIDTRVRKLVQDRLSQFNNKEKEAFRNLQTNPLWFNKEKGIPIKSVSCNTGLSAVEPIKKNGEGKDIGFVKPGNNHHAAIYLNAAGKKCEYICTFWHAVERKKYGLPVIIENPKEIWDRILLNKQDYPESFLEKLPKDDWKFFVSLQQNEMFIMGLSKEAFDDAVKSNNKPLLSESLYRVQKLGELSTSGWWFRHHLETSVSDKGDIANKKKSGRVKLIQSLENMNGFKVKINNIGEIVKA